MLAGVPGSLGGDLLVDPLRRLRGSPGTAAYPTGSISRRTKALLFFAFAFAAVADPVSSVA